MGNALNDAVAQINCCRGDKKDDIIITLDNKKNKDQKNKVDAARSGFNHINLEDDNNQQNGYEGELKENNHSEKEIPFHEDIQNVEEHDTSCNQINTHVDRDSILKSLENSKIKDRQAEFPEFTQEYAISKGNISEESLKLLFPKEDLIYDHGSLIQGKSFYYGYRSKHLNRHGFGVLILIDGSKFEGFWIEGELSLYARHIDSELTVYEGQFRNGFLHGNGFESTGKISYIGSFVSGLRNGFGVLKTETDIYEGNFLNGIKHGIGKIIFSTTSNSYEGEFNEGRIEGKGTFKWSNGDEYIGTFENGILHGRGIYKWKNGDVYDGSYINGMRSGKGKLTNSNGKIYEGGFENNLPHGKGIIIKDGKRSEVEFNNGVPTSSKRKTTNNEKNN